jgi:hypothetical protein
MLALVVGSSFVMSGDNNARRRSQRVMLNASILVETRGADNKPISEQTRTVVVNTQGGVILLSLNVSMGQLLTLRNLQTEEEASCRVVYVSPHLLERKKLASSLRNPARDSGESLFLLLIGRLEVQKQSGNETEAPQRGDERRKTWLMR